MRIKERSRKRGQEKTRRGVQLCVSYYNILYVTLFLSTSQSSFSKRTTETAGLSNLFICFKFLFFI